MTEARRAAQRPSGEHCIHWCCATSDDVFAALWAAINDVELGRIKDLSGLA
jgi:hypothetical protein